MTYEKQYAQYFVDKVEVGNEVLGVMSTRKWRSDPKLLGVTLSRYKFVSKMFVDFDSVLEVGAGDCWYSKLVLQAVKRLTLSDFDPAFEQEYTDRNYKENSNCTFIVHDFVRDKFNEVFDGIYALDVLEHIDPKNQEAFLSNLCNSLKRTGSAIFGMPSLESQKYASEGSKIGHVNCQSGEILYKNLKEFFDNVFIFSMSDETIHTGFMPMAHYLLALCVGPTESQVGNASNH